MRARLILAACLLGAAGPAPAVRVDQPWARATAPHQDETSVYLTLTASMPDRLVAVAAQGAGMAMLHQSSTIDGVSQMRDMDGLDLPAGRKIALAPRGTHIMLMGLAHPLMAGTILTLTLTFQKAGRVELAVPVLPIGSSGPAPG
jgi:copper(I)-binding protein